MSEYIITDEQIAENRRLHGRKLLVMPVIVRCRDCKHFDGTMMCSADTYTRTESDGYGDTHDVIEGLKFVEPGGFCAWAERKVDELPRHSRQDERRMPKRRVPRVYRAKLALRHRSRSHSSMEHANGKERKWKMRTSQLQRIQSRCRQQSRKTSRCRPIPTKA